MTNEIAVLIAVSAIPWGLVAWLARKLLDADNKHERLWHRWQTAAAAAAKWKRIAEQFELADSIRRGGMVQPKRDGNVIEVEFRGKVG